MMFAIGRASLPAGFAARSRREDRSCKGQDGLAVFGEEHEIGFPMAGKSTVQDFGGTLGDGNTL